jgi:PAS domain S-box-containing protein
MSSLSINYKTDLEALCDFLPDGIVILDSGGRILCANRIFLQILGYKTEKIIGESFWNLLSPEDKDPLLEFIRGQNNSKTFSEIRLKPEKGQTVTCEITLRGFNADTDRHIAIFVKKDTERQDLKNALAECETKFKTFFQSAAVCVYFSTEDGKIMNINDAALKLLGYSRKDLSALTASNLYVDPREREYCIRKIKQQGFVQDCPVRLKRKDGQILSCLDSAVLMKREKGQTALYQGILRDITEQKQLQDALAESEAKYKGFFESAPVFAYLTSKDGLLIETNEAGTRLFGYSTKELRKMNVAVLYKNPDDRRLFSEKMKKNGSVVDYPVFLKRKDSLTHKKSIRHDFLHDSPENLDNAVCLGEVH